MMNRSVRVLSILASIGVIVIFIMANELKKDKEDGQAIQSGT